MIDLQTSSLIYAKIYEAGQQELSTAHELEVIGAFMVHLYFNHIPRATPIKMRVFTVHYTSKKHDRMRQIAAKHTNASRLSCLRKTRDTALTSLNTTLECHQVL